MASSPIEVADFSSGQRWTFLDGSERTVATIGPSTWIGRGVYRPGWRWSEHVQPQSGQPSEAHAGYVVSGAMTVRSADGNEATVQAGQAWYAAPGSDAWVQGDEPCVALDFPTA